ncbi:MAG: GNAT family N-acetyltransferase [Clostridia bacterium]
MIKRTQAIAAMPRIRLCKESDMQYFVYLLRCADGTLYTGITDNIPRRVAAHNSGKGAKYTRGRLPVRVVYREICADRAAALRREVRIKKLSRQEKERLIAAYAEDLPQLLAPGVLMQEHFVQMQALEASCYDDAFITPAEEAYSWYLQYPYTTVAAGKDGAIAGFVNLFPVTDAVLAGLQTGTYQDKDMILEDITDLREGSNGPLHLFLCCIAVAEAYRGRGLTTRLLCAAMEPYEALRDRIDWLITDNVTEEGMRLSRRFGLKLVCETNHTSVIYQERYEVFRQAVLTAAERVDADDKPKQIVAK